MPERFLHINVYNNIFSGKTEDDLFNSGNLSNNKNK